ncbi:MAG: hypothetical protein MUC96_27775 [Myxococcaceae bacterium]|nr:hypothetical protein [Myxococcaceae bacterium]
MSPSSSRPTGAAVAAAISPFLGLPLTFLLLLRFLGSEAPDEFGGGGRFSAVASFWAEGGAMMFVVLLALGALATVSAVLMFFGVHRGSALVLANGPLASLLVTVGAFAYSNAMHGALEAITHAAPADQATILAGSTGEAMATTLFGLCAMAGLLSALLPGLLLGALAQGEPARRLLLVAMGVFACLAGLAAVSARRLAELSGSFKAIAHASPADRLTILVGVGEELSGYRAFILVGIGLLVLAVVVGAAVLRQTPRLAVSVPLLGLGGLFGFGSQAVFEQRVRATAAQVVPPARPIGLVQFEGPDAFEPRFCLGPDAVLACSLEGLAAPVDGEVLRDELTAAGAIEALDDRAGEREPTMLLGVVPRAGAAPAWDFLTRAQAAGVRSVGLVGEAPPRPDVALPPELELVGKALDVRFRVVSLGLSNEGRGCGASCVRGTVDGKALVVGSERWTAGPLKPWYGALPQRVAISADPSLSPEALLELATAAMAHEHRLVVVLPGADAPAAEPQPEQGPPKSDREKVRDLMKGLFAP